MAVSLLAIDENSTINSHTLYAKDKITGDSSCKEQSFDFNYMELLTKLKKEITDYLLSDINDDYNLESKSQDSEENNTTFINYNDIFVKKCIYNLIEDIIEFMKYDLSKGETLLELGDFYEISDWDNIGKFMCDHNYLISFAKEVAVKIREYFGEKTKITLVKEVDPEFPKLTSLVAYIDTSALSMEEALELLNKFEDEWYIHNIYKERGRFDVDVL